MSMVDGTLLSLPVSENVDALAVRDLLAAARTLAASVTGPSLGGAERLARAQRAADASRDVRDAVPLLDVYADGKHSRLLDLLATDERGRSGVRGLHYAAAVERLNADGQHRALVREVRAVEWVTWPRTGALPPSGGLPEYPPVAQLIETRAVLAVPRFGPGRWVSGAWQNLPDAFIDPPAGTTISGPAPATLDGGQVDWRTSCYALDASQQLIDWGVDEGRELEALLAMVVDSGLERTLIADLVAGAPAAVDLPSAEALVGLTGLSADLVVVHPTDAPAVRAAYAAAGMWPTPVEILPTIGATAGQAAVIATTGVYIEATDRDWLTTVKPALIGQDIACLRYALARVRVAGSVATVDLPVVAP